MRYLLDANVFMEAKNRYYGLEFCPAFWDWIDVQNAAGKVYSIEKVGDEIRSGDDDLADWAAARETTLFLKPEQEMLPALQQVATWAASQNYEPSAVSTFLQAADYYLVAQALARRDVVVTHEVPSPSVRKVKIPDVCIGMQVKCMSPFEMLRAERARFILERSA